MKITVKSNIGRRRSSNQDYAAEFQHSSNQKLLVLCDGVGGNKAGEIASERATHYLGEQFESLEDGLTQSEALEWLANQIDAVNQHIYQMSLTKPEYSGMSTTLVVALLNEEELIIGYVGDSRAYSYQQGELTQLTEDHSLVNILIKSGEITKQEGDNHPQRNVVTQSVGGTDSVEPDFVVLNLQDIERVMLCSDGLTNMISHEDLTNYFDQFNDIEQLAEELIQAANDAGGTDNITLIIGEEQSDSQEDEGGAQ